MNRLTPVSWKELIRRLHRLGFVGIDLLSRGIGKYIADTTAKIAEGYRRRRFSCILKQAEINRDDWITAK